MEKLYTLVMHRKTSWTSVKKYVAEKMWLNTDLMWHLLARIADHKGIFNRSGQPFTTPSNSSIRDHALETGHDIDKDIFKLCHTTDKTYLKRSESILIRKCM